MRENSLLSIVNTFRQEQENFVLENANQEIEQIMRKNKVYEELKAIGDKYEAICDAHDVCGTSKSLVYQLWDDKFYTKQEHKCIENIKNSSKVRINGIRKHTQMVVSLIEAADTFEEQHTILKEYGIVPDMSTMRKDVKEEHNVAQ